MIIKNVQIYTEDKYFEEGNIYIKDGVFTEPFEDDDVIIDGEGCYAIPGLVDVHFHGCVGHDFCDGTPEAIEKIAEYEASQGITTIVPATMTLSEDELMKIMTNAGEYKNEKGFWFLCRRSADFADCHRSCHRSLPGAFFAAGGFRVDLW